MGVVVLEEGQILHSAVVNLKKARPREKLRAATRRTLARLLEAYSFSVVVVEQVPRLRPEPFALLLDQVGVIKRWARYRALRFEEIAAPTVRKQIVQNGRATKAEVARIMVSRFPELYILLTQDYKYKVKYWQNLYDALALAVCYFERSTAAMRR